MWSPTRHRRGLHRKAVPDGSYDFQKVLDEILDDSCEGAGGGEEGGARRDQVEGVEQGEAFDYSDDFEDICEDDGGGGNVREGVTHHDKLWSPRYKRYAEQDEAECHCADRLPCQSPVPDLRDTASPTGILLFDCHGNCLSLGEAGDDWTGESGSGSILKLPEIHERNNNHYHVADMGTTCSSKFYDRREWHSVTQNDATDPHGKRGKKLLQSRAELKNGVTFDPLHSVPSDVQCTCGADRGQGQTEDSGDPGGTDTSQTPSEETTTGEAADSQNGTSAPHKSSKTSSTLSPRNGHHPVDRLSSCLDTTSGHTRLSRVGAGKTRARAKCDVSPHRLLSHHANSISGRKSSLDQNSVTAQAYSSPRIRSHSWSNGKLSGSGNGHVIRTSLLSSLGSFKSSVSKHVHPNPPVLVKTRPSSPPVHPQPSSDPDRQCEVKVHDPDCPLYIKPQDTSSDKSKTSKAKDSAVVVEDEDSNLQPMTRRRASSESHTSRPRRLLPRTPDTLGVTCHPEHAHVHWADEEGGCALSTCVFLSSIRPRSYSHGAADNVPHRPILKKVAGF